MYTELLAKLESKLTANENLLEGSVSFGDKTITWRTTNDLIRLIDYCRSQASIEAGNVPRRVYAKQVGRFEN